MPACALDSQPAPVDMGLPTEVHLQQARDAPFQGSVVLQIFIHETGRVQQARVLEDPGHGLGDAAARSAVGRSGRPVRRRTLSV